MRVVHTVIFCIWINSVGSLLNAAIVNEEELLTENYRKISDKIAENEHITSKLHMQNNDENKFSTDVLKGYFEHHHRQYEKGNVHSPSMREMEGWKEDLFINGISGKSDSFNKEEQEDKSEKKYRDKVYLRGDVKNSVKLNLPSKEDYPIADDDGSPRGSSEEGFLNDPPIGQQVEHPKYGQHHHQYSTYHGSNSGRPIPDKLKYTKEITIKQGRLKGIIRTMHPQSGLRDVDQFLGLPYAEAPIGSKRFMPPGAPPPWNGVKVASHLPPVCPQNVPDLGKLSIRYSKGRLDQLKKLLPYLKNQSEDCLHLNIYVPKGDGLELAHKYPVIVYIHGESYEWNSGNPYEGSVLASYGQVIVVTINYRLGILGFMRPSASEQTVSNFGLLDQIAALQWVKDNIGSFGGDSNSVTIMGHGTGAACANLLMLSPVAKGLFHRAILMSGSAMSDWAIANLSMEITAQLAYKLSCPLTDGNGEMLECLRKQGYKEMLQIPISAPQFSTSFGPVIDGLVIPNQPYKMMGTFTDLFSRYDLLFGVTEVESYHILNPKALEEGLREHERDNLLRFYMQNRFEIRPDLALAATIKKYTDVYSNPVKASPLEHRDVVLDVLSDSRIVAPLLQTGIFHAKVNPRSYMYVFGHNSEAGPHSNLPHSIRGEELAFVFGAPLAPTGPFQLRYSMQERLLSEAVMLYWTNFAKTGNPKAPWKDTFLNLHPFEWERYDIDWPEFNGRNQCYVNIGIPPSLGYRYRGIYMNFWNKELPDELNQIASLQPPPFIHFFPPNPTQVPRRGTSADPNEIITGHLSKYPNRRIDTTKNPFDTLKILLQNPPLENSDNMYNAQPTFGIVRKMEDAGDRSGHVSGVDDGGGGINKQIHMPETGKILNDLNPGPEQEDREEIVKTQSTVHILVGVVVLFVVLNVIVMITYLMRKRRRNSILNRKLGILSYDGTTDDDLKRSKNNDGDDSYILDIVRKSNTYEAVKTNRSNNGGIRTMEEISSGRNRSPINGFHVTRQLSASTVDAHTKVTDWITQDLVKCSPKSSKKSSPSFSLKARSFLRKPRKVSVAIDATPQARSNSILRQEPIEVTKLKALDSTGQQNNIIICQEVEIDAELLTPEPLDSSILQHVSNEIMDYRGSASSMQNYKDNNGEILSLRIDHKHSKSDPVDMTYYTKTAQRNNNEDEKITSFINRNPDINVTSRDETDYEMKNPLTPEEQLLNIKRRNFPKVLPDYHPSYIKDNQNDIIYSSKRKSLSSFNFPPIQQSSMSKIPPVPPPRTISYSSINHNRRMSHNRRGSNNITTSPLALAEDSPEEEEPQITKNTLIVGPLIPKSQESIYCTVSGKKQIPSNASSSVADSNNSSTINNSTDTSIDIVESSNKNILNESKANFNNDKDGSEKAKIPKPSGIKPPSTFTMSPTTPTTNTTGIGTLVSPPSLPSSSPLSLIMPSSSIANSTESSLPSSSSEMESKVAIKTSPTKSMNTISTLKDNIPGKNVNKSSTNNSCTSSDSNTDGDSVSGGGYSSISNNISNNNINTTSKIPQLKISHSYGDTSVSTEREKSTPESSSSLSDRTTGNSNSTSSSSSSTTTSSSTGTVKTELKKN